MLSLSVAPSAWSATITVDDNGPADYSTIQAAINAAVDGDIVLVKPGTYTATGTAAVVDFRGKAITVRSESGASTTIIDGQDLRRCVVAYTNEGAATRIDGFKIQRGRAAIGAGMYAAGASPTILNCLFESNWALSGAAAGGGLRLSDSSSAVIDCVFNENRAEISGGGLHVANGAPILSGCSFTTNHSQRGSGAYLFNDTTSISACTFSNNNGMWAGEDGGGICAQYSRATVTNTSFSANVVNDYQCCPHVWNLGGAVCIFGTTSNLAFLNCEFSNNRANPGSYTNSRGGAVAIGVEGDETGSASFVGCAFSGNLSMSQGAPNYSGNSTAAGAIAMNSSGVLTLDSCEFTSNSSDEPGGAIMMNEWSSIGTLLIDDCRFVGNGAGSNGGAIWSRQNAANMQRTITDSTFSLNSAVDGGALWLEGSASLLRIGACAFCINEPNAIAGQVLVTEPNCYTSLCADDDGDGFPNTCPLAAIDCNGNPIDDEDLVNNDINNDGMPDDICQAQMNFAGLVTEIRPITDMISGLPTTAVTWRVYATFSGKLAANASVTTIYGDAEYPLLISSASGFYQSATGGNTGEDIACNSSDASLLYDSFFTIAAECFDIEVDLQVTAGFSFSSFNETTNASLSTSNGMIYVYPDTLASLAGADFRVLIMQLTTKAAVKPTALINLLGDNGMDDDDNEWWAYALPIPDPALIDCNENQVHDAIDIALGTVRDCDLNGVPDSCSGGDLSVDCDGDGVPDACEIRLGTATDTDSDGIPDNCQCQGDVDHNGAVNVDDLLEIFIAWGDSNPGEADLNGDGEVNSTDLCLVLDGWGTCL